ncbi:MAG: hypothetical protein GC180_10985 [Bacteroidetes bacterium]|nr:hypothetical protein [Bacteroidota bacterium]
MKSHNVNWILLVVYSIAMAALEAAVVVYLRALFYGETVDLFPLQPLSKQLLWVELIRELATVVMLVSVGWMLGKNTWSRLGYFLAAFGIWDIFYYVFLFLFIQWPQSILSWDVLFLIPVPWFGPVLAPCLISLLLIVLGWIISVQEEKGNQLAVRKGEAALMLLGCVFMLAAFMQDSLQLIEDGKLDAGESALMRQMAEFVPKRFNWGVYTAGLGMLGAGIFIYSRRLKSSHLILY